MMRMTHRPIRLAFIATWLASLLSTSALLAEKPTTQRSYSLAASTALFDGSVKGSVSSQVSSFGFDAAEWTMVAPSTTAPAVQAAPATEPATDGFATLKILGDLAGVHKDFCSIQFARSSGGEVASVAPMVELVYRLNAGVLVVPISAADRDRESFIKDLQRLGRSAARRKIQVALDTPFNVEETNALLDAIGSSAVGIAFDPAKLSAAHADPYQAFRLIGHQRIVQVRITDPSNVSLEDGLLQLPVLKEALDDTGWSGWIVLQPENGHPPTADRLKKDAAYLRSVFSPR